METKDLKVGLKIKKLRELRNYTQEYLAKKLDLSLNAYGKIEREETEITLLRLQQIAEILEVNLLDLLDFDEKRFFVTQNNHCVTQNNHDTSMGQVLALHQNNINDFERKEYQAHINDLQKEISYLRSMLETMIQNK